MELTWRTPFPNYFIAIPISKPEIVGNVLQLQRSLTKLELSPPWKGLTDTNIFKDAMIPQSKLHFTLMVMHLQGEKDIEKAQNILAEVCNELYQEFVNNPVRMTIEGVGSFGKNAPTILYAQLKDENQIIERLSRTRSLFQQRFNQALGTPIDSRPFHPHLTIGKIRQSRTLFEKGIRTFPPEILSGFEHTSFGSQTLTGIQLLQMGNSDKADGGYRCHGQVDFC